MSPGEVADGFLARVLIWESRHDAPMPKAVISFQTSPALEKQLSDIFNIQVQRNPNQGNLEAAPLPKIIPRTEEAQELFHVWAKKYHDLKNTFKTDTEGISSIYGRAAEHAAKLALVHSLSIHGVDLKRVEALSIQWACQTLDYLIGNLVGQIKENIAEIVYLMAINLNKNVIVLESKLVGTTFRNKIIQKHARLVGLEAIVFL